MDMKKITTKEVHNRSGHRVELNTDDGVIVLLPGSTVSVPVEVDIPDNIGLVVR